MISGAPTAAHAAIGHPRGDRGMCLCAAGRDSGAKPLLVKSHPDPRFPGHVHPSASSPGLPRTWDRSWVLGQEGGGSTARKNAPHLTRGARGWRWRHPSPSLEKTRLYSLFLRKRAPIPSAADGAAVLQEDRERKKARTTPTPSVSCS